MFTDKYSFSVRPMNNRLRVWRKSGTRMHQRNTVPTFKSGCQVVDVRGGFSMFGRTTLVEICGSSNKNTYRGIIDNHVLPFMNAKHD